MSIFTSGILQQGLYMGDDGHYYVPSIATFSGASFAKIATNGAGTTIDISFNNGIVFTNYDFSGFFSNTFGTEHIKSFDYENEKVVISTFAGSYPSDYLQKLYVSTDYGLSFTNVVDNILTGATIIGGQDVVLIEGRIYVCIKDYYAVDNYYWYYSDNNGINFTKVTGSINIPNFLVTTSKDYGTSFYLNISSNHDYSLLSGGTNLFTWAGGVDTYQLYKGASKAPGNNNIYAGFVFNSSTHVYFSKGSGSTYTTQRNILTAEAPTIGAASDSIVFIEYDGTLYKSTDSGVNITPIKTINTDFIKFNTISNGVLGSDARMYYSIDGGNNWYPSAGSGANTSSYLVRTSNK